MKLKNVESFWNSNPCGSLHEEDKYINQSKIPLYADFESYKGKKVLEVGCGVGVDGIQFAKVGAFYTGVDLTEAGIRITQERFNLSNQTGILRKANAEDLPFSDGSFDHVYSFGVIHHSPHPERIVDEIYRVLKPGGTATIMLYNKTSFYYLIEVKIIRKLFFSICHKENLCRKMFALFGKQKTLRFETFREKLAKMKAINKAPTNDEWVSMNTDDVFCPIARVYSRRDARKLFHKFNSFKTSVWFIDKDHWFLWLTFSRIIPLFIEKWLERNLGWFRMIQVKKTGSGRFRGVYSH
ncbi:class I SAM-dependent methyltransferase [Patescibacteria group bacterium]|nr:class I SAM-dependent methyltransferase [Patescibacteria group bacterium]